MYICQEIKYFDKIVADFSRVIFWFWSTNHQIFANMTIIHQYVCDPEDRRGMDEEKIEEEVGGEGEWR